MTTTARLTFLSVALLAASALGQPTPPVVNRGPGGRVFQPSPMPAPARPSSTAHTASPAGLAPGVPPGAATPAAGDGKAIIKPGGEHTTCDEARRKGKWGIYFDKVEIEKLVQAVADATCKTFILGENVRGKISIIGPDNGKVEVDAEQFYGAFLAALDANGLTVYPYGKFLKIIEKRQGKQSTDLTVLDPDEKYTTNEQMVTKLFRIRYTDVEAIRAVVNQLVTKDGDSIPFQPDILIVNDIGSNLHRLERIIEQLDRRSSADEIRVIQVQFAAAQDVADKIQKLFESKQNKPGQRPGTLATPPTTPNPQGAPAPQGVAGESSGPATLTQIIPDERTNKLIIIASPSAFERIDELVKALDVPIAGEGHINVYYLANANAEDVASTLQSLASGTANKQARPQPAPGAAKGPATAAELFQGEVKISADKATNSLVIVASQSDYRNLVKVIEKLDIQRRQVFVEAVIMEVNLDRDATFGAGLHTGLPLANPLPGGGTVPLILGTKYTTQGLPPSFSIANLAQFGGFLAGIQGPPINNPALQALGISIPQFGVVLHALQKSSDVNVLSTPHLLTSDNEEAEITVGQNVPFQAGFSPANLGASVPGLAGAAGAVPGLAGGLSPGIFGGGLGSFFAPIQRSNVDLKLSVKPQINESDYVRLVITEQTEEIASQDPVLGPTTSKRSAKTTIVAKDQETVVIGGIMQDRTVSTVSKVPFLGDLPVLGHLFREEDKHKIKTNLLLFLTPYIIRDHSDFRRIFERKMEERQQFIEQFYGDVPGYEVAIDFGRKQGPLSKMGLAVKKEELKAENGGPGLPGERVYRPLAHPSASPPVETTPGAPPTLPPPGAPVPVPGGGQPLPAPPRPPSTPPQGLQVQPQ